MRFEPCDGDTYERALRTIGRRLDSEPSYHASVVEGPAGFTVRWQSVRHRSEGRVEEFGWQKIRDLSVLQLAGRQVGRKHRRLMGLWAEFPTGQEDFFRALGYRLDQEHAANVSIDELADCISVSYLRASQTSPESYESHHDMYTQSDVAQMLSAAQARRRQAVVAVS